MNLKEVNKLIAELEKEGDHKLVAFYQKKRRELVKEIVKTINKEIKEL